MDGILGFKRVCCSVDETCLCMMNIKWLGRKQLSSLRCIQMLTWEGWREQGNLEVRNGGCPSKEKPCISSAEVIRFALISRMQWASRLRLHNLRQLQTRTELYTSRTYVVKCSGSVFLKWFPRSNRYGTSLVTGLLRHMSAVTDVDFFWYWLVTSNDG
jgi:hypothetical protein